MIMYSSVKHARITKFAKLFPAKLSYFVMCRYITEILFYVLQLKQLISPKYQLYCSRFESTDPTIMYPVTVVNYIIVAIILMLHFLKI